MSAVEPDTPPDHRAFDADANKASFLAGVHRGDWLIEKVAWPTVEISIAARPKPSEIERVASPTVEISVAAGPKPSAPERYWLRCDFSNYPADAPTATPWDPDTGAKLAADKRPKGDDASTVFRSDWEDGRALYAAYDRIALTGHANWMAECPRTAWNGTQDLAWWVMRIWELLNEDDDV
ncbi:hypothetical protein [Pseudolysinimonas sp.]|uniref:DUF7665 family protein n=1 Tax=Pseudolysinimonas sp. TaxID=2680009 RepID=UPI00286B5BA2|nr:hypothetical protein [Pseudolysinimonas sp.]